MKKLIAVILSIAMLLCMASCGAADKAAQEAEPQAAEEVEATEEAAAPDAEQEEVHVADEDDAEPEESESEAAEEASKEAEDADDTEDLSWNQLEAFGKIETENGILVTTITLPADLAGEVTQEQIDAGAGEFYTSGQVNEDGSVTYKMTKAQRKAMLDNTRQGIDEAIAEMVADEEYAFTEINYNESMTAFDVSLSTTEVGMMESFAVIAFYMYGGMYNTFAGNDDYTITVNYYAPDGNLIQSANSADMAF